MNALEDEVKGKKVPTFQEYIEKLYYNPDALEYPVFSQRGSGIRITPEDVEDGIGQLSYNKAVGVD